MRKTAVIPASLTAALLLATAAGCGKMERPGQESRVEMTVLPESEEAVTRGYSEGDEFNETTSQTLHSGTKAVSPRTMQLSARLHPQSGAASDYFVGKTFSRSESSPAVWYNTNTVGGAHDPIYWPVGGKLDFLAYSLSAEGTKGVTAKWDADDASSAVVLTVPGENSQNDILYASAYDIPISEGTTIYSTPNSLQSDLIGSKPVFASGKPRSTVMACNSKCSG